MVSGIIFGRVTFLVDGKIMENEGFYIQQKHGFKKLNLRALFGSNHPAQNDRNDRGIISWFARTSDFDMVFTSQNRVVMQTHISWFSL